MTALASEPRTVGRLVLPNDPTWEESLVAANPNGLDDKCRFSPIEEMDYCFEPRGNTRALETNEFRIELLGANLENYKARAPLDLQMLIHILKDLRQERNNEVDKYATCPTNAAYLVEGVGLLAAGGKMPARDAFDFIWRLTYSARVMVREQQKLNPVPNDPEKGFEVEKKVRDLVQMTLAKPDGLLKVFGISGVYPEKVREFDELLEKAFAEVNRQRPRPALRLVPKEAPPLPTELKEKAPPVVEYGMLVVKPTGSDDKPTGDGETFLSDEHFHVVEEKPAETPEQKQDRELAERVLQNAEERIGKSEDGDEDEDDEEEDEDDEWEEEDPEETPLHSIRSRIPQNLGTFNFGPGPVTLYIAEVVNITYGDGKTTDPVVVTTPPTSAAPAPAPPPSPSPLPKTPTPPPAAKPASKERKSRPAPSEAPKASPAQHGRSQAATTPAPPVIGVVKVDGREMLRCRTCKAAGCESDFPKSAREEHERVHEACSICGFIFTAKTQDRRDQHPDEDHFVCACTSVVLEKNRADHNKDCPLKGTKT